MSPLSVASAAVKSAGPGERWRALVIQHDHNAPGGYLEAWLRERGAEVEVLRIWVDRVPDRVAGYEMVAVLGSEASASDDSVPWLAGELALLAEAFRSDVPMFGICFGVQVLARALGGSVTRSPRPEIGWLPIRSRDPGLVPEGPWMQWHFDTFEPPPGATLLGDSAVGPQAFAAGRTLGVQFHPEASPEIVADWAADGRATLLEQGVDPDRLVAQAHELATGARAAAWRLFDSFLAWARPAEPMDRLAE